MTIKYPKAIKVAEKVEEIIKDEFPMRSLADYTAQPNLEWLLNKVGSYFEYPIRNKFILGHSMIDNLGESTMINKNIEDPARKAFTQAHELGHHFLHPKLLRNNRKVNILDQNYKPEKNSVESEANCFAANLLMPDDVLYSVLYEKKSRKSIKELQCISYEALYYRIIDYLVDRVFIPKNMAIKLSKDYITSLPGLLNQCTLVRVWKKLRILNLNPNSCKQKEIETYNLNQINNYENIENIQEKKEEIYDK